MSTFSDAVLALSPNSYWRFEGASPLADSGSAGITLTGVGSPVRTTSLVPCEQRAADNAYDLNGSTMYLHAGNNYSFTGDIDWTVLWWQKIESGTFGSGFQRMFEKRDTAGNNPGYIYYGQGVGGVTFDIDFGSSVEGFGAGGDYAPDVVSFMGVTWEDSTTTLRFYKDGFEHDSDNTWTTAPGFPSTTANFLIGGSGSSGSFAGVMDDFAVWSGTALSATQIRNLWISAVAYQGAWLRA